MRGRGVNGFDGAAESNAPQLVEHSRAVAESATSTNKRDGQKDPKETREARQAKGTKS